MKSLLGKGSGKVNGNYYANAQKKQQDEHKAKDYVPMLPDDFLEIDAETRSWLYPIYPFRTRKSSSSSSTTSTPPTSSRAIPRHAP